ncbi:MAG: hypothetical protein H7Y03_04110 [Chitinophagaceae bacterium]|nr:hypothetical protein [Chitinophagaceae bacterium]
MKKALLLINGLQLPHPALNAAIEWAKEHSAALQVLFLTAASEQTEEYAFPSDIDAANDLQDEDDAIKADVRLLKSQMLLVRDVAAAENVECKVEHLVEPSLDEMVVLTAEAMILITKTPLKEIKPLMGIEGFSIVELTSQARCEVLEIAL